MPPLESLLLPAEANLREIMGRLEQNASGIVLLVDAEGRLVATVTDGDVRRSILRGEDLAAPVHLDPGPIPGGPVTAPQDTPGHELIATMQRLGIRHIPLLDDNQKVTGLARLEDLLGESDSMRAVVMAGGMGKRLRPLTESLPKPLLPVGDQPLLSRLVTSLQAAGIERVSITTHFLAERIHEVLGDGSRMGLTIDYVPEDEPLGTAGSLSLLARPLEPTLVINGDILTRLNFRAMLEYHQDYKADMTVAVKQYDLQVPYGVVECENERLQKLVEKPNLRFFVVAGIYLLDPSCWDFLEEGKSCDMPALIESLVGAGRRVVQFPVSEYWLDIGSLEHYQRAQQDADQGLV